MKARSKHSKFRHSRNGTSHGAARAGVLDAAPGAVAVLEAPQPVTETVQAGDAAPVAEVTPPAVATPPAGQAAPASEPQPQGQTVPEGKPQPQGQTEQEGETPPEAEPTTPHRQSQAQLDTLARYRQMRNGLDTAGDAFRLLMPSYGLTEQFLINGESLNEVAGISIAERHRALAAAIQATERQAAVERLARTSYGVFRRMARTVILSPSDRIALGLDEPPPKAMSIFVQSADTVLAVAQEEPYVTLLATATFDGDRLAEAVTAVRLLATAIDQRQAAAMAAKRATEARDAAVGDLRVFLNQLRVAVGAMLRLNPHLSTPAGF